VLEKYDVFDELIERTSFLKDIATPHQRFLCIENNITFAPNCPCCGNSLPFNYDAKSNEIFMRHCSVNCANSDPEIIKKRKQTSLEKYGVENPSQTERVKEKIKQTNIKRYGVACTLQSEKTKRHIKELNMKKHGHKNPMQNPDTVEKAQKTMLQRYGKKHALQIDKFVVKVKTTNKKRYGAENISRRNLSKDTLDILNNKSAFIELLAGFKNTTLPVFTATNTEIENMLHNNYRIIYDCGNLIFSLNNTKHSVGEYK